MCYVMREIQYYINTSKEAQSRTQYRLLAQLYQIPTKVKPYFADTTPAFGTGQDGKEACKPERPWDTFSYDMMMDWIVIND